MFPGIWIVGALIPGVLLAQKGPQLGYVFPPAIRAGETTDVQLGGFDFTPDLQWFVYDDNVELQVLGEPGDYQQTPPPYWSGPRASSASLPIPREVPGRLRANSNVQPGIVRWQVANANGTSNTALFFVSCSPEIVEQRSRDLAQRLPELPISVSGRLSRLTEVDAYELVSPHDGLISIELMARRLGANFNGVMDIRDSNGNRVADMSDTQGVDGGTSFLAKAGQRYVVRLHDADFRGDRSFVYRLAITLGPRVQCTIPAAGQRGTEKEVELIGQGIRSGRPAIESIRATVQFPSDPDRTTHTLKMMTAGGPLEFVMPLSDLAEHTVEQLESRAPTRDTPAGDIPTRDNRASQIMLNAPCGVTGRIPDDLDEVQFGWQVAPGETWSIELQSRAIGGTCDMSIQVLDPAGKSIAQNDDQAGTVDAAVQFKASVVGAYTVVCRNVGMRLRSNDEIFRLQLDRPSRDFRLHVPQHIDAPLGGKAEIALRVERLGEFAEEISVDVEGLPEGVSKTGDWRIPANKNEHKVTLEVQANAASVARPVRFFGFSQRGKDQTGKDDLRRGAQAVAAGNLCPRSPHENLTSTSLLNLTMSPPFEVRVVDRTRQRDVPRGSTCLAEIEIVRNKGFEGEVRLQMAATQARYLCGSHGFNVVVPGNATQAIYPTFMSEATATEYTMRMAILGVAVIPDPQGKLRHLVKPADAQITMIMEGALLKLSEQSQEPSVRTGDSLEIPVRLSRSDLLPVPIKVELIVPAELAGLIRSEELTLAPGSNQGLLRLATQADERLQGNWPFRIRATALQDGRWPVISETDIVIYFRD